MRNMLSRRKFLAAPACSRPSAYVFPSSLKPSSGVLHPLLLIIIAPFVPIVHHLAALAAAPSPASLRDGSSMAVDGNDMWLKLLGKGCRHAYAYEEQRTLRCPP